MVRERDWVRFRYLGAESETQFPISWTWTGWGWNWNGTGEAWMVVDVVIHRYSSGSRGWRMRISSNWMAAALGSASRESTWAADAGEALLNLNSCVPLPSFLPLFAPWLIRDFYRIEIAHFAWICGGINFRIRRTNIKFHKKGFRPSVRFSSSYKIMGDGQERMNGKNQRVWKICKHRKRERAREN